jgi:hypothetical protein
MENPRADRPLNSEINRLWRTRRFRAMNPQKLIQKNSTLFGEIRAEEEFSLTFAIFQVKKMLAPKFRRIQLVPGAPELRKIQLARAQSESSLQFILAFGFPYRITSS